MATETTDSQNIIDQPEVLKPRMVTIEISGKQVQVPEGITVIKAMWYAGQERRVPRWFLRRLRDVLPHERRSKSPHLFGVPNGGSGRHVLHHDAAFSCAQGHI
jgi:hypothetical protein